MKRMFLCSVLALCATIAVPTLSYAADPEFSACGVSPGQPLNPDQMRCLVMSGQIKAQMAMASPTPVPTGTVLVNQPATVAPASGVSGEGAFGFSWTQILGGVGTLALMVFGLFKGAGALKAKQMVIAAAEGAWHIAERAGAIYELDGATKGALALEAFIEAMGGSVNKTQIADAKLLWKAQSAKAGASAISVMVPPAPTVDEKADSKANAAVADKVAGGASAGDMLREARKS